MNIDLRKYNLREVPIGTVVTTSKGFNFELIGRFETDEHWLDVTSGLVWMPKNPAQFTHNMVMEKFGDSIPTRTMVEEGENHGFREVLDVKGWYWTSTPVPGVKEIAWGINGFSGKFGYGIRSNDLGMVLCVSRGQ